MADRFFFAWVSASETTYDAHVHAREDEDVFSFTIEHLEGEFPSMQAVVRNPRVGLLTPGRKVWAWLSRSVGGDYIPVFFGRLVGVPSDIFQELVTLDFIARPTHYNDLKANLAETLKVFPYYDPVWINKSSLEDPDTILEARSAMWHIDRTTLNVTISDILVGEDGVLTFNSNDVLDGSLSLNIGNTPLGYVSVSATINWTQRYSGAFDMNPGLWRTTGGEGLLSGWPKAGQSLQGGYHILAATARDVFGTKDVSVTTSSSSWTNKEKEHENGDTLSLQVTASEVHGKAPRTEEIVELEAKTGNTDPYSDPPVNEPSSVKGKIKWTFTWLIETTLAIGYEAARGRSETLEFIMRSEFQPLLTEVPEDDQFEQITISGQDVDTNVGGSVPIGNTALDNYFPTDRGLHSVEYLLLLARARLINRCRTIEITFTCTFLRALNFSCRKNVLLYHDRLPGGQALGKITGYTITCDGSTGDLRGTVTMVCAVGTGASVTSVEGEPDYVDDDYVDPSYQVYLNELIMVDTSDIVFSRPVAGTVDDGLRFPLSKQAAVLSEVKGPSSYKFTLRNLTSGPFEALYSIEVSNLVAPKQIDLEAT